MKFNKISLAIATVAAGIAFTGCNMYGKFKMPEDSALGQEYVKATEAQTDSTAFGNLKWQEVFTDPVLTDLIYRHWTTTKTSETPS